MDRCSLFVCIFQRQREGMREGDPEKMRSNDGISEENAREKRKAEVNGEEERVRDR